MSDMTYNLRCYPNDKPLVWLHGEVKSPPFSRKVRFEVGLLLRKLQKGQMLEMPHSMPMLVIGERCHELRIMDADAMWRIFYRIDPDAIVILEAFAKKSRTTPRSIISRVRKRLREYDDAWHEKKTP